jgi:hypothetical protein
MSQRTSRPPIENPKDRGYRLRVSDVDILLLRGFGNNQSGGNQAGNRKNVSGSPKK